MTITKNSIIYQVITDRYDDLEGKLYSKAFEPTYGDRISQHFGGSFKGIQKNLDYISELGITHLLLSPLQKSKSYHGYDIEDFYSINEKFGSKKDLKSLINDAHKKNISIIMDYVATHVSSDNKLFKNKLDNNFFLFKEDIKKSREYRGYYDEMLYKVTSGNPKIIEEINPHEYLSFFGLPDYPLLNLKNKEVIKMHKEILDFWIDNFGIDDVRLDSSFLQPIEFVSEMNDHLIKKNKGMDLFVEYWDFNNSFGNSKGFSSAEYHIPLGLSLNNFAHNEDSFNNVMKIYFNTKNLLKNYNAISFLDSHDVPRFKGGKDMQKIAATLQFVLPFTPLVYYGNEIGMVQHNDARDRLAQSRDVMRFDLSDENMITFYKNLINFRKNYNFEGYEVSDFKINDHGQMLSFRFDNGKTKPHYVILNKEGREKPIISEELFSGSNIDNFNILTNSKNEIEGGKIVLKPRSANVFYEK